jgi:predicted transcriptional regulator
MIDSIERQITMLGRHLHVLQLVIANEPIGIVKISDETGYPRHKVRYSLRVLEADSLIKPTNQGAVTTERTADYVTEYDERVGDLTTKLGQLWTTPEQPEPTPSGVGAESRAEQHATETGHVSRPERMSE